jgi:ribose-phosphate pyrophosphokinase
MTGDLLLFALEASRSFGEQVAATLGIALTPHEERAFEEGEHKARPLASVRGADVYVVHSLHGDDRQSVNDKLCRLLFFLATLRDAGAARVTAIAPYLCYARKDRRTQPRDPVTTCYVAQLFEAVGVDRVVTLDVHNLAAFQNAFRCPAEDLEARPLFVRHAAERLHGRDLAVVSPDVGGMKRAEAFRRSLGRALSQDVPLGFMEKRRALGEVSGERLFAEVAGRTILLIDDLIGTGTTLARAAAACLAKGAAEVHAFATHGLFVGKANDVLAGPELASVVVTDVVPPFRLDPALAARKLVALPAAPLVAAAIAALHGEGSIVELLAD